MNCTLNKLPLYLQIARPQIRRYLKPIIDINDDKNYPNSNENRFQITSMRNKRHSKPKKETSFSSKGWNSHKSKGDYFIIEPFQETATDLCKDLTFSELGLENSIIDLINKNGFTAPSEIQMKAIPAILNGNNSLINAETGSGKTLAYALPLIQQILKLKNPSIESRNLNHPLGLIICPSRELAQQIGLVIKTFTENLNIPVHTLSGGETTKILKRPFFKKMDILVSTLGVLSKLVTFEAIKMSECKHIIIDEADTMLDDSFNEKLVHFLNRHGFDENTSGSSQITLVSATHPRKMDTILESIIDVESIQHVTTEKLHCLMPNIRHKFLRLTKEKKPIELLKLLKGKKSQTIVFSDSSPTCDFINILLNENNIKSVNLNGDMKKRIRDNQLESFMKGECQVLSCTDAGSRGIDHKNVNNIINYDCPLYVADYLHRSGRTGRLSTETKKGNPCQVITFVSGPSEIRLVQEIEQSARNMEPLSRVNANVKSIIKKTIDKSENMKQANEWFKFY